MEGPTRLWTVPFVALTLAELAYFSAVGMAVFTLPLYLTGPLGSGEAAAGLAFGAFALVALVLRPWAGRLCDGHGRRPLLVAGAGLCAVGMLLMPVTTSAAAATAVRALQGVGEAAFVVAGFAALADLAPPDRIGEALSLNSLGLYLGLALGPLLADVVLSWRGYDAAWLTAGVLAALSLGALALVGETRPAPDVGPETGAEVASARRAARLVHVPAVPVALGFFTALLAIGGFLAFASLRAGSVGLTNAGTAFLLFGGTVVTCRVVFARVPDRMPSLSLAAGALAVISVGLLTVALWPTPAGFLTGIGVLAVGVAFSTPAFFTAVFSTAGPGERGTASATASIAVDAGLGLGPVLLGAVAEGAGLGAAFGVGAVVAAAGGVWMLRLRATAGRPAGTRPAPPRRSPRPGRTPRPRARRR